jgi:hypothetical protein
MATPRKGAASSATGVLHAHNVDCGVVVKQGDLLMYQGFGWEQQVIVIVENKGSASHNCLVRGSLERLSVHTVMQKVPRSARLAVSEPRRSTHLDEHRMHLAVSRFQTIGGTPITSR